MTGRFLAVDAGNSKTVAVVVDAGGGVLGRARGGRGDIYNAVTPHAAAEAVIGAIRGALAEAGVEPGGLQAPRAPARRRRLAGGRGVVARAAGRRPAGPGHGSPSPTTGSPRCASACWTASASPSRSAPVRPSPAAAVTGGECCSGWMVFDHLGGLGLADAAVRAVCLAWMGIGPPTALTPALLGLFGVADPYELRHVFTRLEGRPEQRRGAAAPPAASSRSPATATRWLPASSPTTRAPSSGTPAGWLPRWVACRGRTCRSCSTARLPPREHGALREALCAELAAVHPDCPVSVSDAPPLAGCVLDALAEGGVELTAELRDSVIATYHPPEFLTT